MNDTEDLMYTKAKMDKRNRIDWMKEETPQQMAGTSWMVTLIYNIGKQLTLTPDKIRVAELNVPVEDWITTYEDWVADMMEKYGTSAVDSGDALQTIYEDLMRHYVFDAVMKAFPDGFDYKITEDMSDLALEKVKKVLGTWKDPAPIW